MVLLKHSLIAVSAILLSVGIFTSCSDGGDDDDKSSSSGVNTVEFRPCSEVIEIAKDEGCDPIGAAILGACSNAGADIINCALGKMMACAEEKDIIDDICGEASTEDCAQHYGVEKVEECAAAVMPPSVPSSSSNEAVEPSSSSEGGVDCAAVAIIAGECGAIEGDMQKLNCLNALDADKKDELCALVGGTRGNAGPMEMVNCAMGMAVCQEGGEPSSSSGEVGGFEYLSCKKADLKQLAMLECATLACMQEIQSELCGDTDPTECGQYYATNCSGENAGLLTCPQAFALLSEAGCTGSSVEEVAECAITKPNLMNDLCGDISSAECKEFYATCFEN